MRRKEDRTSRILELLVREKKLEVAEISAQLGVSQVTVRKDLDSMEAQGLITREHGFAVLSGEDDIKRRLAYHYEEKRRIALRGADLVKDGETIMIESGSCCALLASVLTELRCGITIITNSAFIADYIRRSSDFQIILLGGIYQQDARVMVGPMVRLCAENFWVDQFFIGVDGWSERTGFTNQDQMRAQAVRDMARQADRVTVLTESEKFTKHGTVPLNLKDQVRTVITDQNIDAHISAELAESGIEVLTG
ncbi:MAG: DeoR/GlpR family DNA-binding transcription regulator [Lachnospiraceae bacterium]|nr:DeoR/GlpR family DNA-binding transcription regulator [Lachnospiraceae bacterium]